MPDVSVAQRMARFGDRMFDRMRDKRAFAVSDDTAIDGDFAALRGQKYALLVTFRRNGEPMPSPVWIGVDEQGRAYVRTAGETGKVKRLRRDSRVLLAPSNARGRPTGPAIRGTARLLPEEEWPHAEATLSAAYGAGRRIVEGAMGGPEELAAYIEISAGR